MKRTLLSILLLTASVIAQQQPKLMTKMVVQLESSDAPAGSFAAKPKTMLRAGTQFCRVEEEPDLEHGIHGVMIISEPDVWMVNLADKTARHIVDPGPTFNCRMPLFAGLLQGLPEDESKQIAGLEFGNELDFFKGKGATAQQGTVLQTKQTVVYKLQFGESTVALFTYGNPERPLAVALSRGEKHEIFWYSGYGQVDFDPKLFAKPEHVAIEEAK